MEEQEPVDMFGLTKQRADVLCDCVEELLQLHKGKLIVQEAVRRAMMGEWAPNEILMIGSLITLCVYNDVIGDADDS